MFIGFILGSFLTLCFVFFIHYANISVYKMIIQTQSEMIDRSNTLLEKDGEMLSQLLQKEATSEGVNYWS